MKTGRSRETQIASQEDREKARAEREAAQIDAVLLEIAKRHLHLETLEAHKSGEWDLNDATLETARHALVNFQDALKAAYEAGRKGEHVRREMGL